MKIVIVSTSDLQGGASRSAYRTHVALVKNGYNSTMVVLNKSSNNPTVIEGKSNRIKKIGSQVCNRLIETFFLKKYPNKSYFSTTFWGSQKIVNTINSLKPDVVHIHWIHQGALSIYDLKKIQSPIIWSMHDMWALTGGCHYDHECGNFINKCGQCVVLNSYKKNDLSYTVWKKKKSIYSNIQRLYFAGPSSWMFESAKKSSLLQKKTVIHLPTAIDVSLFKKINTSECRSLWNLPKNKKLVLFGALAATKDKRKGFQELKNALNLLSDPDNIEFVVFGSTRPKGQSDLKCKTHYLGNLNDEISLVTLYNAVDVMVVPSKQENLSNAILESLACGTPVVAFNIGGNQDMIKHKENGYLAVPFNCEDLKNGIHWVIDNKSYSDLVFNAREHMVNNYSEKIIADKHLKIYQSIYQK